MILKDNCKKKIVETSIDERRQFVQEMDELGDKALDIILDDLDNEITGVSEYDGEIYTLTFYIKDNYLGSWDVEPKNIENVNILNDISEEINATCFGLHERKNIKVESMDGKDVIQKIEYIRDGLDSLELYVNKNGAIPANIGESLCEIYHIIDSIYEYTSSMNEATSGIGGAYTTKSIDLIPKTIKMENLSDEDIKQKIANYKDEDENNYNLAIDPSEAINRIIYNNKKYYIIGEGEEVEEDGKMAIKFLTYDEKLNKYISYFEVTYIDDGDGESGPQELTMDFVSDTPFKLRKI